MEEHQQRSEKELNKSIQKIKHTGGFEGREHAKKFGDVVKASRRVLFSSSNVFPFDFFPDKIIIDENKVDMVFGLFFFSQEVFSIPYNRISSASSSVGLFFGTLTVEIQGFEQNPPMLTKLWKQDAIKARRIINGLVTANRQGIDLSKLDLTNVSDLVEEIGTAQTA